MKSPLLSSSAKSETKRLLPSNNLHSPNKNSRKESAAELVGKYEWLLNLDEESLGHELHRQAANGKFGLVRAVLDRLRSGNRDDVALPMIREASDQELQLWETSSSGSLMLSRIFDELTSGNASEDELTQANRILAIKGSPEQIIEASEHRKTKFFLFKQGSLLGGSGYPISAKRIPGKKVQVRMYVSSGYIKQLKKEGYPYVSNRIVLSESEIVGIKMYDLGGEVHFRPALYLVQISNVSKTKTMKNIGETVLLGASLGTGGLLTKAARGGWAATAASWADRAASAIGILTMAIKDNRGWIISKFGNDGKSFVRYVDLVNSLSSLYSIGRLVQQGGKAILGLRRSFKNWKKAAKSAGTDRDLVAEIEEKTEDVLRSIDNTKNSLKKAAEDAKVAKPVPGKPSNSNIEAPTPVKPKPKDSQRIVPSKNKKQAKGNQKKSVQVRVERGVGGKKGRSQLDRAPTKFKTSKLSPDFINRKRAELFEKFPDLLRRRSGDMPSVTDDDLRNQLARLYKKSDTNAGGSFGAAFEEIVGTRSKDAGDHVKKLISIEGFLKNIRSSRGRVGGYAQPKIGSAEVKIEQMTAADVRVVERMWALLQELKRIKKLVASQ